MLVLQQPQPARGVCLRVRVLKIETCVADVLYSAVLQPQVLLEARLPAFPPHSGAARGGVDQAKKRKEGGGGGAGHGQATAAHKIR